MPQTATSIRRSIGARARHVVTALAASAMVVSGVAATGPASAAVGDEVIAWLEVEDGTIVGGPALNSGDHGNFSGSGSYTFRESGMRSTMTFQAPAAGTYPVWVRYAAGPLSAEENVTRAMGLLTNGGARQVVSYPLTGSWESWGWARADVALQQGTNTLAVDCQRSAAEMCRLNFDAVQVGGTAPDPCVATPVPAGSTALFDGTFASFDQWRKASAGGFGRQVDCTLRGFRGPGATWTTAQQSGTYTIDVDWRRGDAAAGSSVYVASTSNGGATPAGGYQVRIGATDTAAIVPTGGTTKPADAAAVAEAVAPVGQWNRFTIQVTPARLRVLLNGRVVNAVDHTAPTSGHLGLENRAGTGQVSFRDIRVRPGVDLGTLAGPVRRATGVDGTTSTPSGESTLANLVADALRWATRGASGGNAKIAFVNPTALRADLVADGGYPASTTYARAAEVLGAEPLVNMRLNGTQIKTVLEQQWQTRADGTVPSPAFVHLGASSGLTWTHDASRPAGDRITGVWLDGVPLKPTGNYSVTVSQSLASGGDNFRGFTAGQAPQVREASTVSALAAYISDASTETPLAAPQSQRGVGVHVPADAPTSYAAGTTYAVDLSAWSYSGADAPRDDTVDVTVAGRPVGSFPVDNTSGAPEDHGQVAVRATLPVDLPAGATTVRIVGSTTGTAVQLPIVVTPAPAPAPVPTPTPTPTPTPSAPPIATKARAAIKVAVPKRVVAKQTRAKLAITVDSAGATPTGTVTVKVGTKRLTARLRDGRATVRLPVWRTTGTRKVVVSYAGDAATRAATRTVRIRVRAAR
ncbi:5'-nucleotidase C-terminal domain-containing protein [Nocardioides sp. SYSU D00065]|uniref:5'-nucleotidase C-terminal domain-containing protein n=1 Tax=Nocardioides sp. SYSU D00065 TaxID=2817378 RepID=UPI001B323057|nr:5'-nucleotidase C-terminal domain-containing protein [Nocardioides sp. SYSU D00065]